MQCFLLGIDLEDVRLMIPDGVNYKDRFSSNCKMILDLFEEYQFRTTFFVVGNVARSHPRIVREIIKKGHEIACHSDEHRTLDLHNRKTFHQDLERNVKSLEDLGSRRITGFRAPTASLTAKTQWAYEVLYELGFRYSSSVIPGGNPLYGWPEFGQKFRTINKVLEIPISVLPLGPKLPFGAGTYLRVLPNFAIQKAFKRYALTGEPVVGYLHPYDFDFLQEKFMHPGLNNSRFMNSLMYLNRKKLPEKLRLIFSRGWRVTPYQEYIDSTTVTKREETRDC